MSAPTRARKESGVIAANWWHLLPDGRVQCDLCPRFCQLREGQRGFCYIRQAMENRLWLTSYGRASGFCIDPIEKKPLYHFYPGSSVFSFGTAGCNLGCQFCQNWDISRARTQDRLLSAASPVAVVDTALRHGCRSVAFTYNDPVIFAEYAIDCARVARARGLRTVAVTAGYITAAARPAFFQYMDAANVDLKALSEDFYRRICYGQLQPVLDTLLWLKQASNVWLEITNLLIPGHNDAPDDIGRLCGWIVENLGPTVPLHFSAFHPDFRMRDVPPTPPDVVRRARAQALAAGMHYVYTGNIRDPAGQTSYCPTCHHPLIKRDEYHISEWNLSATGRCPSCRLPLPGHFAAGPGSWGARRQPVWRCQTDASAATDLNGA